MEAVGSRPDGAGEAIAPVVDSAGMIPATCADAARTPTPTVGAHTHTPQEPSEVNVGVGVTESPAGAAVLPHDPHDGSASSSSSDDSDSDDSDNDEAEAGAAAMDAGDAVIDQTKCCMCKVAPRYRCPGCARRTCSLDCCKQHKVKFECNGKRARSQFAASVREMNDASLLGDYYLMEDASRLVGGSNRGRPEKRQRNTKAKQLPFKLKKLVQAVEKQQGTLLIMPEEFERRKVNKSYFDDKRECVLWTIRWTFPEAQAQYLVHKVPDNQPVSDLLSEFLAIGPETVVRRARLKPYIKPGLASIDHLRITIGAEHCQPGELRDLPCPMDKCLRDVISGITLIEFPVLTVHIA
eukprot:m.210629 g.210629  ORF g.210629 m.210629 type:complete len:352 (+) comp25491_c0_seq1:11-1066(+)